MKFRNGLKEMELSCPKFKPGLIDKNQLQYAFGQIGLQRIYASGKAPNLYKIMKNPVMLKTIQIPFERSSRLLRIAYDGTENIWASRNDSQLYEINIRSRAVLKNTKTASNVLALSIDSDQNVVFIVSWPDTKVYKYESNTNTVKTLLKLSDWCP